MKQYRQQSAKRLIHSNQKSLIAKSSGNLLSSNGQQSRKLQIKHYSNKPSQKDFMNFAEKSTQDTTKFKQTLSNLKTATTKDRSQYKTTTMTYEKEVKKYTLKQKKQIKDQTIRSYDKLKVKNQTKTYKIPNEKKNQQEQEKEKEERSCCDSIESNELSSSSLEMEVQTIWNSDINEHDLLKDKKGINFKSPFTNKNKQNWFDKYSPERGFGQKSALKNDKHSVKLSKHIDQTLEIVALQINKKESLKLNSKNMKVQLAFIKKEQEKIIKDNQQIYEKISKQQRKIIKIEEQKVLLKNEIEGYRSKITHYSQIIEKQDSKLDQLEVQSDQVREKYEKLQQEIQSDIDQLQEQRNCICQLQDEYTSVEQKCFEFQKKFNYASRLEQSRTSVMKEKSKMLESLINEKRLTIKYGKSVNSSPIAKKIRSLVKANHQ